MKQKILEALKQGHKNLGLSDEAFERVAAFGETFITSEEQIPNFVKGAEAILKSEQSAADKVRSELNVKIKALEGEKADLEAKLNKGAEPTQEGNEPPKTEPQNQSQDLAKLIADAVANAVKPLSDELAMFKGEQATKNALAQGKATFESNDWVKKYKDEAEDAWERAVEYNELSGNKMTAEQLQEKALGYFGKAVSRKGDDITKPLPSTGDGNGNTPDFKDMVARLQASGKIAPENQ